MLKDLQIRRAVDECMFTCGQLKRSGHLHSCTHINECLGDIDVLMICLDTLNKQLPNVIKLLLASKPDGTEMIAVFYHPDKRDDLDEIIKNVFNGTNATVSDEYIKLTSPTQFTSKDLNLIFENFNTFYKP